MKDGGWSVKTDFLLCTYLVFFRRYFGKKSGQHLLNRVTFIIILLVTFVNKFVVILITVIIIIAFIAQQYEPFTEEFMM